MQNAATDFESLYREVFRRLHRRDGPRSELSGASRAVLTHLSLAGPLTIGEAADHLDRAQSVVSDIVTQLESKGWLERRTDPDDRRRTLVWLTESGVETLRVDEQVLSQQLVAEAIDRMRPAEVTALVEGMRALVAAATTTPERGHPHDHV